MHTRELWEMGDKYVSNFKGVYPLDKLPASSGIKGVCNFIVNTHTHNLPGEHWLAVSFQNNVAYAFDSFGHYYPWLLQNYLIRHAKCVHYNTEQFQEIHEKTCGYYCIAWLIDINIDGSSTR